MEESKEMKLHLVPIDGKYKMVGDIEIAFSDFKGYYLKVHNTGEVWIRNTHRTTEKLEKIIILLIKGLAGQGEYYNLEGGRHPRMD